MFSKILYLFFTALLVISFSACGGEEDAPSTTDETSSPTVLSGEGSTSSFVLLTLDQTYSAQIGNHDNDEENSYYKFTTADAGDYIITASNLSGLSDLDFVLYSESSLTFLSSIDATVSTLETGETLTVSLNATTTYYLQIINYDEDVYFDLIVEAPNMTIITSEGSSSNFVTLYLDSTHNSTIGASDYNSDNDQSYYSFTTIDTGVYNILFSSLSLSSDYSGLQVILYSNSSLSSQIGYDYIYANDDSGEIVVNLDAGTTYYLLVQNATDEGASCNISVNTPTIATSPTLTLDKSTLSIDESSTGTITVTEATTDGTTSDTVDATSSDTSVATVSLSGSVVTVTGIGVGTTTVTVTSSSGLDETVLVTVTTVLPLNEGSPSSPFSLTLDDIHSAKVGAYVSGDERYSYYSFTTGIAGDYNISASGLSSSVDLDLRVTTDNTYTTAVGSYIMDWSTDGEANVVTLEASTTYYLYVVNYGSSDVTFDLLVEAPQVVLVSGYDLSVAIDSTSYNSSTNDLTVTYTLTNGGDTDVPTDIIFWAEIYTNSIDTFDNSIDNLESGKMWYNGSLSQDSSQLVSGGSETVSVTFSAGPSGVPRTSGYVWIEIDEPRDLNEADVTNNISDSASY